MKNQIQNINKNYNLDTKRNCWDTVSPETIVYTRGRQPFGMRCQFFFFSG